SLNTNTGVLSGTPQRPNVGDYSGITLTASSEGQSSSVPAFGRVLKTIHPPKWAQKQFNLPNASEDSAYSQELSKYALNYEGTPLTYEIVSATPPPWIQLGSSSGTLFGTPHKPNLGSQTVAVVLKATIDGQSFTDTATFTFQVI